MIQTYSFNLFGPDGEFTANGVFSLKNTGVHVVPGENFFVGGAGHYAVLGVETMCCVVA